jgi:uncharacterized oxidoreductase
MKKSSEYRIIKPSPQVYLSGPGVISEVPGLLGENKFRNCILVHGGKGYDAVRQQLDQWNCSFVDEFLFRGECSMSEIERLQDAISNAHADVVVGVGGGKIMDCVKTACFLSNIPEVLVPTSPSNCASCSGHSVIYTEDGVWESNISYADTPYAVIVDTNVMAAAPRLLLLAGFADTLSKWYEGQIGLSSDEACDLASDFARESAAVCGPQLVERFEKLSADFDGSDVGFRAVVDTIFLAAGLVGGIGGKYAPSAAAHAFYNAVTSVPSSHALPHGIHVAFGLLFQLELCKAEQESVQLAQVFSRIGMPIGLGSLGIGAGKPVSIEDFAEKICSVHPLIDNVGFKVSPADVAEALLAADELIAEPQSV